MPPVVQLLSPGDGASVSTSPVTIKLALRSPDDAPVTSLRVRVNGQPINLPDAVASSALAATGKTLEIRVPVLPEDSEIQVFATNRNGVSAPAAVRLAWKGVVPAKAAEEFFVKPKLYILAVGVSNYDDPAYRLGLAAKDAHDFADAMKGGIGVFVVGGGTTTSTATSTTSSTFTTSATTPAAAVHVSIPSGAGTDTSSPGYSPDTITVVIGVNNTVEWVNNDNMPHTVTATNKLFDSGNMNPGDTFSYTFTSPGNYSYGCSYHPWMKGTVIVKGP